MFLYLVELSFCFTSFVKQLYYSNWSNNNNYNLNIFTTVKKIYEKSILLYLQNDVKKNDV